MSSILQILKGKFIYREHHQKSQPPKQFQLTGNYFGEKILRIGSLRQLKPLRDQWRQKGITDLEIAERIEDEAGLYLVEWD